MANVVYQAMEITSSVQSHLDMGHWKPVYGLLYWEENRLSQGQLQYWNRFYWDTRALKLWNIITAMGGKLMIDPDPNLSSWRFRAVPITEIIFHNHCYHAAIVHGKSRTSSVLYISVVRSNSGFDQGKYSKYAPKTHYSIRFEGELLRGTITEHWRARLIRSHVISALKIR